MDSINSNKFASDVLKSYESANIQKENDKGKLEESGDLPKDSVESTACEEARKFTDFPDVRIPTVTKKFSQKEKKKIMSLMKPGDIALMTNDAFPTWQVVEKFVVGTNFTHAAIYEGDGKFLEATPDKNKGVTRSTLGGYFNSHSKFAIIRPPYKNQKDVKSALDFARSQIGKPFDKEFDQKDDREFYCSKLVQRSLESMPNPIFVEGVHVLGRDIVPPSAFESIPGAEKIYSSNSNFSKSMASHYPVYLSAMAAATIGGLALGPLGATAGLILGIGLSVPIGNKMQTGKFRTFYT